MPLRATGDVMDYLNIFAMGVGYGVLATSVVILVTLVIDYSFNDDFSFVTVFGFGLMKAKPDTVFYRNINKLRDTEGQIWFVIAPTWFNRYIWNIGGIRKGL